MTQFHNFSFILKFPDKNVNLFAENIRKIPMEMLKYE